MKHFHLKARVAYDRVPTGQQVYRCGMRVPLAQVQDTSGDLDLCAKCNWSLAREEERSTQAEEALIEAGVLEPNFGPNRRHNEY